MHADLSEYNILYHVAPKAAPAPDGPSQHEAAASAAAAPPPAAPDHAQGDLGHLYIIDVSQSVEHDHPHAFDFLRADLRNVEDFFARRGVPCLGLRRAFEFVTKESLADEGGPAAALARRLAQAERDGGEDVGEDAAHVNARSAVDEDSVFMRSYIPRTLNEVFDPERDVGALNRGEGEKLIYKDTIGIVAPKEQAVDGQRKVQFAEDLDEGSEDGEESATEDESGEESQAGEDGEEELKERKPRGHRHEDKEAKKVCNFTPHPREPRSRVL